MRNRSLLVLGSILAATLAACDPYSNADGGGARIVNVLSSSGASDLTATEGTLTGTAWTVNDVPTTCETGPTDTLVDEPLVFILFDKQIRGSSVQTSATDCTPAGNWLTVTPAAPAGSTWFSCFNPGAPGGGVGSSVVLFLADSTPAPSGWDSPSQFTGSPSAVTTYHFTGNVADAGGTALPIDVTLNLAPDVGDTGTFAAGTTTDTDVPFTWAAASCGTETGYRVLRSPHGAGTFAPVEEGTPAGTFPTGSTGFTDAALTNAAAYDWRFFVDTVVGTQTFSEQRGAVTLAMLKRPVAPTFTGVTATSVTVNWLAITGAASYNVQRAPESTTTPGAAGSFTTIAFNVVGLTYTDTTVTSAKLYFYRLVPVNADGITGRSGLSGSVTTP